MEGGIIEIFLDSIAGTPIGTCSVANTSGFQNWTVQSCKVSKEKGVHDVYFVFKGAEGDLFYFDWWQFNIKY